MVRETRIVRYYVGDILVLSVGVSTSIHAAVAACAGVMESAVLARRDSWCFLLNLLSLCLSLSLGLSLNLGLSLSLRLSLGMSLS